MKRFYEREILKQLKKWVSRKEIYAIKGPRQAGKTTVLFMLRDWLIESEKVDPENIIFITFEDRENLEKFSINPKEFIGSFVLNEKQRYYFLLDEFHYVREGGRKLKLLYDTTENIKFIITGSSSLELTGSTSKYLVGRMFSFYLSPFSLGEFLNTRDERLFKVYKGRNELVRNFISKGENFTVKDDIFLSDFELLLEEFIVFGGYPEVIKARDKETKQVIIKNIYETYVGREIIELLRVHDIFKFRKLITLLGSRLGGMVNYNDLASLSNSYYKEIIEILDILEETFIVRIMRPYHRNLRTELRKNPKAYFVDLGLRNYLINNFNGLGKRVDVGVLVENFVLNQLSCLTEKINYWRTLGKAEVDFILTFGDEVIPVEVKYTLKRPSISRGFRSFISAYNPKRALIITKNYWGEIRVGETLIKFVPACYL
ncbi:MAG: ATP-binding protein [Candidatus Altiarchaeales archaeon]|nr:ATP-binding protein [Candidatus Altiarchaeales archaeon]